MESLLNETLSALGVKTINEAIPLIKYARIRSEDWEDEYILHSNHTNEEAIDFLSSMAEEYGNMDGNITLNDGTWIDISEWGPDDEEDDNYRSSWWKWVHCIPVDKHYTKFEIIVF